MSSGKKFLLGFAGGIVGLLVGLAAVFVVLDGAGVLKAPAFSNRLSFDEKLRLMRRQPIENIEVLAVGSSTTLHGVDGAVLREELGFEGSVANLGVQDLRINQSRFVAETFLPQYPHAEQLVMVSTMLDFKDCEVADPAFFNPDHVIGYVAHTWPEVYYHFKYLDLAGVAKRARSIGHLRATQDDLESVSFDQFGGLLLTVPRERINQRVWDGDPITLDPLCYESLREFARDLEQRGIRFTYVIAPMRPGYLEDRDPDGSLLAEHHQLLRAHLDETETMVIDAHDALDMPEDAFFDAYHLHRDKAQRLTRFVGEQMTILSAQHEGGTVVAPRGDLTAVRRQANDPG